MCFSEVDELDMALGDSAKIEAAASLFGLRS